MVDQEMLRYNAIDASATYQIWGVLEREAEKYGYLGQYNFLQKLIEPLTAMQLRGIKVDMEKLEETKDHVGKQIVSAQERLNELCGEELNVNSPKQCIAYFYYKLGHKPYISRKTGRPTTDDTALQRLARKGVREAAVAQELRGLLKLRGTYLEISFDADGRLRCNVNPRGTTTGRISTSKTIFDTGANMQNLDPRFRGFLIADDGYFFLEVDKARAEWVIVAFASGDANMMKVVHENLDPHSYTAHMMFGLDVETIKAEDKLVGHLTDPGQILELRKKSALDLSSAVFTPRNMSFRQAGKKSNHGLNYDEAYKTFALINEISEGEAKRIINLYHGGYPNIRNVYHEGIKRQLGEDRTITNCFGEKRRFLDSWGDALFRSAYAHIPQSTVAHLINQGIISSYYDEEPYMQKLEGLMQVHDSYWTQYPLFGLEDAVRAIYKLLDYLNPTMSYSGREFQIASDVKVGFDGAHLVEVKITGDLSTDVEELERTLDGCRARA